MMADRVLDVRDYSVDSTVSAAEDSPLYRFMHEKIDQACILPSYGTLTDEKKGYYLTSGPDLARIAHCSDYACEQGAYVSDTEEKKALYWIFDGQDEKETHTEVTIIAAWIGADYI